VWDHLHNAASLLLEGEYGRLLIIKVFLLNSSHCALHIVEVDIEALFHVTIDCQFNLVLNLPDL
jgi:hypothetical protein